MSEDIMLVATHARVAVHQAIAHARRSHKAMVDTADLLVGVAATRDGLVAAVWRDLGVDPTAMRRAVASAHLPATAVTASRHRDHGDHGGRPAALTADARRVLSRAFVHARAHGARRLGAGHLLLAIAAQAPGDAGRAVLAELGVDAHALTRAVCRRLSGTRRPCGSHVGDVAPSVRDHDGLDR